jgi:hypothetical protein
VGLPFRDLLAERLAAPVFVEDDANAAALAEWTFGAGRGHQNLLVITVGTGVGAGLIVERVRLPVLAAAEGVRLAAVFEPDGERADKLAADFSIPQVCRTFEELCALAPDVALVANPNHLHAETSIRLLEAGAHVLCEKPMATRAAGRVRRRRRGACLLARAVI